MHGPLELLERHHAVAVAVHRLQHPEQFSAGRFADDLQQEPVRRLLVLAACRRRRGGGGLLLSGFAQVFVEHAGKFVQFGLVELAGSVLVERVERVVKLALLLRRKLAQGPLVVHVIRDAPLWPKKLGPDLGVAAPHLAATLAPGRGTDEHVEHYHRFLMIAPVPQIKVVEKPQEARVVHAHRVARRRLDALDVFPRRKLVLPRRPQGVGGKDALELDFEAHNECHRLGRLSRMEDLGNVQGRHELAPKLALLVAVRLELLLLSLPLFSFGLLLFSLHALRQLLAASIERKQEDAV